MEYETMTGSGQMLKAGLMPGKDVQPISDMLRDTLATANRLDNNINELRVRMFGHSAPNTAGGVTNLENSPSSAVDALRRANSTLSGVEAVLNEILAKF